MIPDPTTSRGAGASPITDPVDSLIPDESAGAGGPLPLDTDHAAPPVPDGTSWPATDAGALSVEPDEAAAEAVTADLLVERTLDEATVVARAQDRDPDAYGELVNRYQAELFRLAYRMVSDRGDAQDIVQDSLTLAWRKLPTLTDPQAFHAWIYHLTTRQCLNLIRRRSRQPSIPTSGSDLEAGARGDTAYPASGSTGEGPAQAAETSARMRSLDEVLTTLPAEQRACWVLKELHDLSYPEISYALGVPVSTVRGRIARARRLLAIGMSSWR